MPSIPSLLKKDRTLKARGVGAASNATPSASSSATASAMGTASSSPFGGGKSEKFVKAKEDTAVRQRLIKFYEVYNPSKLDDGPAIDELLRRYQGREQQLFSDLETKYILSGPKTSYVRKKMELKPATKVWTVWNFYILCYFMRCGWS